MKRILPAYLCLLSLSVLSPLIAFAQEAEYRQLFNGQDLAGWYGNNPHTTARVKAGQRAQAVQNQQAPFQAHWSVEDGQLVNDGQGVYLTTNRQFGDMELLQIALQNLENESPRQYAVAMHRFIAGLSVPDTASILKVSERTVERDWKLAKAKLLRWMKRG